MAIPASSDIVRSGTSAFAAGGGGGGSPGGTSGQVQYNNGGAFAGASHVLIEDGYLRIPEGNPTAPSVDGLKFFARNVGGRMLPGTIGPSGHDSVLQPHLGRNKWAQWLPAGNSTTITAIGAAALTATGTATAANVATTNRHTWMRRLEYLVTTAATTAVAGFRGSANVFGRGQLDSGHGGFHLICQWGPATGTTVATKRAFVGVQSNTAAPTDVNPSTLLNMIGMGWDSGDANIQMMHNDASGTATKINLGASFPVPNVDRASVYEISLFAAPGASTVNWMVRDLSSGAIVDGVISTDLPAATTLLSPRGYTSVGGTSSVVGIALMSLYIETDY